MLVEDTILGFKYLYISNWEIPYVQFFFLGFKYM